MPGSLASDLLLDGQEGALGAVGDILAGASHLMPVPHFFLAKEVLLAFFIREQLKQRGNS